MRAVDALPEGGESIQETTEDGIEPSRSEPRPETKPAGSQVPAAAPAQGGEDGRASASEAARPKGRRDFAREFAAELDRAASVIGGRQTTVERRGDALFVRVIPTAVSGFLGEKGLSGKELERVRTIQFSELKLKELGIALIRPAEPGGAMALEKRVEGQA